MDKTITASELQQQLTDGSSGKLIDVRSPSEFAARHIPGAVNIPMDQIESRLEDLPGTHSIVLVCQGGQRAQMVAGWLKACRSDISVLAGGTAAWVQAGLPTVASARTRWALERQVRLAAGLIVLTGVLLGFVYSPGWFYLAGFVGLGLTFAGITDICAMGALLCKMPWNAAPQLKVTAGAPDGKRCSL